MSILATIKKQINQAGTNITNNIQHPLNVPNTLYNSTIGQFIGALPVTPPSNGGGTGPIYDGLQQELTRPHLQAPSYYQPPQYGTVTNPNRVINTGQAQLQLRVQQPHGQQPFGMSPDDSYTPTMAVQPTGYSNQPTLNSTFMQGSLNRGVVNPYQIIRRR